MTRRRFNAPGERAAAQARIEQRRDNERRTAPRPCRVCGKAIRFVTIDGRWRLLDAERVLAGNVVWLPGEVVAFLAGAAPDALRVLRAEWRLHDCRPGPDAA